MMMNKLKEILESRFGNEYKKTIYACSCSNKQSNKCINCNTKNKCILDKDECGFIFCDYLIYDFDEISTKVNKGTSNKSIDSLTINSDKEVSLIEFTDGNPRNKKTHKKCLDSNDTIKKIYREMDFKNVNFYLIYNTNKFKKSHFENYIKEHYNEIDNDIFLGLMDLNADEEILIRYFTLTKVKELYGSVFAMNQNNFVKLINSNTSNWNVL